MADNRGVAYMGTGKVEVQDIDFPSWSSRTGPGQSGERRPQDARTG